MPCVKAVAEAEASGETVAVLDGGLVEGPLIRNAHSIIQRYEEFTARDRARAALAGTGAGSETEGSRK